ncbi:hypothetical protein [Luteitalea sp.]|uniref:hypothetical protein n=1 Tax=Luteitalea sp. TaxID=2004800 RepID=UPI0025C29B36|nr:hypothetical protein [Luteitalea sp.]
MGQAPAQPTSDAPPPPPGAAKDDPAVQPALPAGPPAGTGILRTPGVPPQEVPLMSIRKDEPANARVQVGPITPGVGVPDVLLGSIGIVVVAVIASVALGALLGGVLVLLKHRLGWGGPDKDAEDHITLTDR